MDLNYGEKGMKEYKVVLCNECSLVISYVTFLDTEETGGECECCGEEHGGNGLYTILNRK